MLDTNQGFISATDLRIAKLKSSIHSDLKGVCTTVNVKTLAVRQIIYLRACPPEDQAGVMHVISPISVKLGQIKGHTQ